MQRLDLQAYRPGLLVSRLDRPQGLDRRPASEGTAVGIARNPLQGRDRRSQAILDAMYRSAYGDGGWVDVDPEYKG